MIDPWSDTRLARVLASVGEHLDTDPARATAPAPGRLVPRWSRPQLLTLAAAITAVIVGITLAIAPVREALADLFGIGSTGIELVPEGEADPAGLPTIDEGLRTISPAAAASRVGHALPHLAVSPLGEPERIASMPEGGVLVVWSDGATTLWIHPIAIPTGQLYSKLVDAGQDVEPIDDLGDDALAVTGDHILDTPHRRLRAGTVVLWTAAETEYRLESELDLPTMRAIARDLD